MLLIFGDGRRDSPGGAIKDTRFHNRSRFEVISRNFVSDFNWNLVASGGYKLCENKFRNIRRFCLWCWRLLSRKNLMRDDHWDRVWNQFDINGFVMTIGIYWFMSWLTLILQHIIILQSWYHQIKAIANNGSWPRSLYSQVLLIQWLYVLGTVEWVQCPHSIADSLLHFPVPFDERLTVHRRPRRSFFPVGVILLLLLSCNTHAK